MANLTDKVVASTVLGLLGYEFWTLANKSSNDTISETVWKTVARRPLISFGLGMLMGHFIWLPQGDFDRLREEALKGK